MCCVTELFITLLTSLTNIEFNKGAGRVMRALVRADRPLPRRAFPTGFNCSPRRLGTFP